MVFDLIKYHFQLYISQEQLLFGLVKSDQKPQRLE